MEPFLDRLAGVLLQHHGHQLGRVAVVLPGRRAGLYLRKYLAQRAGTALWSPEMLDMGAFMERITGMRQGGTLEMLFMLHEAHRAVEGERADGLMEFMNWAPTTLRDLSEVDTHLLPLDALYRDLRAYSEIDEWSFRLNDPLSPGQERMLRNWSSTGALHLRMAELINERRVGTSGALARVAAEQVKTNTLAVPWNTVWFAGLNALDPATTAVVSYLRKIEKGHVAWDADRHYLTDERQEAGRFLRRSIAMLGPGVLPAIDELRSRPRRLNTITVPNKVAQARYAARWLADLSPGDRADTAVVLADEDLLMPLLEALPADLGPLNVTMGLPLTALPIHGLAEALLDLHVSASNGVDFHMAAIEPLLLHPFLHQGAATNRTIAVLRSMQRPRIRDTEVLSVAEREGMQVSVAMRRSLTRSGSVNDLPGTMNALLTWAQGTRVNDRFAQEQLFRMARLQREFEQALVRHRIAGLDLATYAFLRTRLLREERMTFLGEPLNGLQVMGFLETRAIDHGRVLLLGANEGTLPRADGQPSWIPFEVRRAYGLPLRSDSEAITAYHFERLLHLADEVQAVTDSGGGDGTGEVSRFLAQWEHELAHKSTTEMDHRSMLASFPARSAPAITVFKGASVQARLNAMAERGFSPSALGMWLRCPLDLYFRRVLGIKPPEEITDELGSDVLGAAVHHVLEHAFRPMLGKPLTAGSLQQQAALVPQALYTKLNERFSDDTLARGHFRLRREMAQQAVSNYLLTEADRCTREETVPLNVEEEISAVLPDGTKLLGRCDRIELRDGITCILDLKTGNVQAKDLVLKGFEREHFGPDQRYALQLLVYAWILLHQQPSLRVVRAGIIPLQRATQADGVWLKVNGSSDIERERIPEITALLTTMIGELRDPAIPFQHNRESRWCTCCIT
ncbi:MAG: PD-(D/E)XK nuclease family protein [Flavobacteriales bacterium]